MHIKQLRQTGFTIVELLIVIVVIGILSTVSIVAYSAVSQRATAASLQSDLSGAATALKLYQVDNGSYPTSNDCTTGTTPAPPKICLKSSSGNSYSSYVADNASVPQTFSLTATHGTTSYVTTHDSKPTLVAVVVSCPTGYILVPGSSTYGTSNFCTMKYEAKNVGGVATSTVAGTHWVNITQTTAISTSAAACTGCHLITEAEFMTVAQNVLGVASNWSGGAVGSGFIYSGHSDGIPLNVLNADSNDANGYAGTGQSSPSNQRRTLTLSNGEVIWDLAGNLWEWTAGTATTGQPGIAGEPTYAWKEWTAVTANGSNPPNPSPSGTGIAGASTWNLSKGVGQLQSWTGESALRGFLRGGYWYSSADAGVLTLLLYNAPSTAGASIGFRVSQ